VDPAAELGAHRTLARRRREDDPDRLLDVLVAADERERAARIDPQRKGDAPADDVDDAASFLPEHDR
jgi:hypothetical protein